MGLKQLTRGLLPSLKPERIYRIADNAEQFREHLNNAATELNAPFCFLDEFQVEPGPVKDAFKITFSEHLVLLGIVNKEDASVQYVTMIGTGDGTTESGQEIFLLACVLVASADPSLSGEQHGNILRQLGLFKGGDPKRLNGDVRKRNGLRYQCSYDTTTGFRLTVSHADDPS